MNLIARLITTALIAALAFVAVPSSASANHDPAVSHTPYCAPKAGGGGEDCSVWCQVPAGGTEPVCGEITCVVRAGDPEPLCTPVQQATIVEPSECDAAAVDPVATDPATQAGETPAPQAGDAVAKVKRLRAKVQQLRQRLRSR